MLKRGDKPAAPKGVLDLTKKHTATMNTDKGAMVIELFAKDAPLTVENFINLSRVGFYDGVTFHRVIPGFMAQAGDPTGTGRGGPGYRFSDEFSTRKHDSAGVLSMANAGPNTNGSQFFITFAPTPHLDGRHTVFGKVVSGLDVLKKIAPRDPMASAAPGDKIASIEITEA